MFGQLVEVRISIPFQEGVRSHFYAVSRRRGQPFIFTALKSASTHYSSLNVSWPELSAFRGDDQIPVL